MAGLSEPAPALRVRLLESTQGVVVVLAGDVDLATFGLLERVVEPLLELPDVRVLDFDLAEVHFMDSSGLGVLLRAVGAGKRVRLRNPSAIVRELLAATGLSTVVEVEA